MGGMASLSGPAPVIWVQLRGWARDEQRGVNQPFNMAILATALLSAAIAGLLDRQYLIWAAIALPTTIAAPGSACCSTAASAIRLPPAGAGAAGLLGATLIAVYSATEPHAERR